MGTGLLERLWTLYVEIFKTQAKPGPGIAGMTGNATCCS